MNFALIICTYMRPNPLLNLLKSVQGQTLYPNQIIIIDGSTNNETRIALQNKNIKGLEYFLVDATHRGLTRQRNFGLTKVGGDISIVCFLDDDIILSPTYFEKLIGTYTTQPEAIAVGGYILGETIWKKSESNHIGDFYFDGWHRKDGDRFVLRKRFGLQPTAPPAFFPEAGHGRSVGFLPPSGKVYLVEQFMGGVSSYKKEMFDKIQFSTYFEGYSLYEDAEFCFRLLQLGKLYVNTSAQCEHHHNPSGRPNHYKYGKMVMLNGWYVWRVRWPNPSAKAKLKWHDTALLLALIRFSNIFTKSNRKAAFMEFSGRVVGWFLLIFNQQKVVWKLDKQ